MRRALFVAGDRSLTRLQAEALLDRDFHAEAEPGEPWTAARAHSALEAKVLIEVGSRPFDVVVIAPRLPDGDAIELIADLRRLDATREVPLFLMTERGRDTHSRRIAAARYRLAGFIELPAAPGNIRHALDGVRRRRRVLLVEPRPELAERYRAALERGGFVPAVCPDPRDARERRRRFDPDLVAVALLPPQESAAPDGLAVCAELKRGDAPPKVLVYGPLAALEARSIPENAQRADDFVKAPFDDELLVVRAGALVGLGAPGELPHPSESDEELVGDPSTRVSALKVPSLLRHTVARASPSELAARLSRETARRHYRRVPCDIRLEGEADGRAFRARSLDISNGGMFFALRDPFPVGTGLRMRFELPDGGPSIEADGRVAWVGEGPDGADGMGVEFARVAPADLDRVVDYVNRLSGILYHAE